MSLKPFVVSYNEFVCRGTWRQGEGIVVANTEKEALGLCLQKHSETQAENWEIEEVNLSKPFADVYVNEI